VSGHDRNGGFPWLSDFVADEMETDYLRQRFGLKMATYGIAHRLPQCRKLIGFRKNGNTQRTRRVAALGRFFDKEYEFFHMYRAFMS